MTWQTGRVQIDGMISQREIERVAASSALANRLLDEAMRHLASAESIQAGDPAGSYQLAQKLIESGRLDTF